MKIVFDNIIFSLQKAGGISVVWASLISRILKNCDNSLFIEYTNDNITRKQIVLPQEKTERRKSWWLKYERYHNPKIMCNSPFIFHSSYFRICNNPYAINVTTVHDFTYELFVKNPIKRWIHCWQKHQAIRRSDAIVCISENTRKDLHRILPNIPKEKTHVIYNGINHHTFHIIENRDTQNYVLYVGNRDPYKNFDKVIEPVSSIGLELKITGAALNQKEIQLLCKYNCKYEYLGYVSNEELNDLYNHAICLVYPSEYEGFGLPVIEAQSAGCPVVAFNGSATKEIIGDDTLLLSSTDSNEIRKKIRLAMDPDIRNGIIKKGIENANLFSWEKMAERYDSLYKELYITRYKDLCRA